MYTLVTTSKIGHIEKDCTVITKDQYGNTFEARCEVICELNRLNKLEESKNIKSELLSVTLIKKNKKFFKAYLDCGKEIQLEICDKSKNLEMKRHELNLVAGIENEKLWICVDKKCTHSHSSKFKIN